MKNRKIKVAQLVTVATALCALVCSGLRVSAQATVNKPLITVNEDFKLNNGLRVILSEDHSAPVASIVLIYDVGARDEQRGKSGFAHLFEHMMFQGSDNVGKTEHFKLIQGAGGSCNASTHPDYTNYYDRVPSNQVNLALWLEADRMRSLKVTEDNFKNQLDTVKEEKRLRIDNQPYQPALLKADEVIFGNWNNAHPVIGSFEDLESSSISDVRNFFKSYYCPSNAVLVVVGDIDSKQVHQTIEDYFGKLPSAPQPTRPDVSESQQGKERYAHYQDDHAKMPAFQMAWKVPGLRDPDYFALATLQKIFSDGESSRLYRRLVKDDQIALKADAGMDLRRGPSSFNAFIMIKPNTTPEKARSVVWSEIEKLQNQLVTEEELQKAKNQILRDYFSSNSGQSLQKTLGRASLLAQYTSFFGDPSLIDKDMQAAANITPEDVQRVAKKYFTRDGITIIDIEPAAKKLEAGDIKAKS